MRDLQRSFRFPPSALELGCRDAQVVDAIDKDRTFAAEVIGEHDERRRPVVSSIAATFVPSESMANTTLPPKMFVKYSRSAGTSRLGV